MVPLVRYPGVDLLCERAGIYVLKTCQEFSYTLDSVPYGKFLQRKPMYSNFHFDILRIQDINKPFIDFYQVLFYNLMNHSY